MGSLFRRLKDEGLAKYCYNESSIRTTFRRCSSLAFLTPSDVRRGMALIIEQSPNGMEGGGNFFNKIFPSNIP